MIADHAVSENNELLSSPMEQERADYPPVAPSFLADFIPSGHTSPAIAVSRMADDLGPDLVQLLPQRGEGPVLHPLRQCQSRELAMSGCSAVSYRTSDLPQFADM